MQIYKKNAVYESIQRFFFVYGVFFVSLQIGITIMRSKVLYILLLTCLSVSASDSLKHKIRMQYRLSGTAGWLNRDDKIAGTKTMIGLTMDRPVVTGATIAAEFLPTSGLASKPHKALRQWNNASIGVAATWLNLGQNKYLGNVVATWTYLNIPLYHSKHFILGLRPGVGVAFADKRYSNTVPEENKWTQYQLATAGGKSQQIANISIGSIANAFINGGLYFDFPIKAGWSVSLTGGWQHVSNGSVLTPNAGYNMFNAEVGVAYTPYAEEVNDEFEAPEVPRKLWDGVDKRWDIEIGIAGGARSVYYKDRSIAGNQWLFGVGELTLAAHWIPLSIFKIGAGVDVFYDGAYRSVYKDFSSAAPDAPVTFFGKTYLAESKISNCFRVGISLQPEFIIGNLTVGYHLGLYLYDPIKNLEPYNEAKKATESGKALNRGLVYSYDPSRASTYQDGWFYQRLQLKYRFCRYAYAQVGLKLHIMKAEFLDAGLGLCF